MEQANSLTLIPLFFLSKVGKRHVVLLSPPDVDDGVSESVCQLGSQLCNQGFSVSVDQWSRMEQCTLGPLLWLHSKLLEMKSQGGRIVLVLTRQALERAEEWTHQHKDITKTKLDDKGLPQMRSPYSDVFMASLCLIQAEKQLGRAGERFLLVRFDSHPCSKRTLPKLLQGLPLFQLPSQTQSLLTELTVGGAGRGSDRRTWTRWKWRASDGWRTKTKEGPTCKYVGVWAFEALINVMPSIIVVLCTWRTISLKLWGDKHRTLLKADWQQSVSLLSSRNAVKRPKKNNTLVHLSVLSNITSLSGVFSPKLLFIFTENVQKSS